MRFFFKNAEFQTIPPESFIQLLISVKIPNIYAFKCSWVDFKGVVWETGPHVLLIGIPSWEPLVGIIGKRETWAGASSPVEEAAHGPRQCWARKPSNGSRREAGGGMRESLRRAVRGQQMRKLCALGATRHLMPNKMRRTGTVLEQCFHFSGVRTG